MSNSNFQPDWTDPSLVEPAIFWFWNDTPTPQQIDERLASFAAAGFGAVYVHPMPQSFRPADFHGGMELKYLSPAFFDLIDHTCRTMRRLGMVFWLYDEGGWPSGMAGGAVVAEDPSYGIWVLDRHGDEVKPAQLIDQISYPDLMNPAATDCFLRHTHEAYRARIGAEFGKTVRGIFTDEPRLIGRLGTNRIPWSPLLPDRFLAKEVVFRLFDGAPNDDATRQVRRDYLRNISKLVAENYYGRIRRWCEQNNLLFEGHHSGEDDYARHGEYFVDYMEQARQYHIPGADTIWRQIFPGQAGGNYVGLASSVGWLRNQRIAVSESFAVYGAGLTLEQMKWVTAFQLVRGVNKIGVMPSLLSTRGSRRISLVTNFSPKNPIWNDIDLWCDFLRRTARFTLRGLPQPRVGIYYRTELVELSRNAEFNRIHEQICDRVHDVMAGLVFVGPADLANAKAVAGGVRIGAATISLLVVHVDGELDTAESELIARLEQSNVRVIRVVRDAAEIDAAALRDLSPVRLDREVKGVRLLALSEGNWKGYLFFNQTSDEADFTFAPKDIGQSGLREVPLDVTVPADIDPVTASAEGFRLHLMPGACRAFEGVRDHLPAVDSPTVEIVEARGAWKATRLESFVINDDIDQVALQPEFVECELGDYAQSAAGLNPRDFSGSLIYQTRLMVPDLPKGSKIILDLGTVFYSAEVWINGQSAGRRGWSPYWFDLTEFVHEGENELRVRTTNTLANQWLRPDIHARDTAETPNMYLTKSTPFMAESLHSGLAGPVRLHIYSEAT